MIYVSVWFKPYLHIRIKISICYYIGISLWNLSSNNRKHLSLQYSTSHKLSTIEKNFNLLEYNFYAYNQFAFTM